MRIGEGPFASSLRFARFLIDLETRHAERWMWEQYLAIAGSKAWKKFPNHSITTEM
jgi:hypothetical protein